MSKPDLPPRVPGCTGRDTIYSTPDGRRLWARVCSVLAECPAHECDQDEYCYCTFFYCPRCECQEEWAFLYQTPFPGLFVCFDCLEAEPLFHERLDSYTPEHECVEAGEFCPGCDTTVERAPFPCEGCREYGQDLHVVAGLRVCWNCVVHYEHIMAWTQEEG